MVETLEGMVVVVMVMISIVIVVMLIVVVVVVGIMVVMVVDVMMVMVVVVMFFLVLVRWLIKDKFITPSSGWQRTALQNFTNITNSICVTYSGLGQTF